MARPAGASNPVDSAAGDGGAKYDSIMCSTAAQRIAEIGRAIDDLAVKAGPQAQAGRTAQAGPAANDTAANDTDPIVARVAELWALLAELDPEVGKRLAGYQNLSSPADLCRTDHPGTLRQWEITQDRCPAPDWRLGLALPAAR